MIYSTAKVAVQTVMTAGDVPVLIGTAGVGKTSMMHEIAEENDMQLFVLEGNLLKEGEVGGLPYMADRVNSKATKQALLKIVKDENLDDKKKAIRAYNILEENLSNGKEVKYAPFHVINSIVNISEENPDQKILLFIDELNRCSNEVCQELMNIILQRNINGYEIPDNVYIIAAMNPSGKFEDYKDTDYSTLELDHAQMDRCCFIQLDTNAQEWIKWGNTPIEMNFRSCISEKKDLTIEDSIIHTDILEYIATFPESLNVINKASTEDKTPTPRAWERVSRAYYLYVNGFIDNPDVFYNIVKGNVGSSFALEFINFTKEKVKKILEPEVVFAKENLIEKIEDSLPEEITSYVENESPIRLLVFNDRLLKYLEGRKYNKAEYVTYVKVMHGFPTDMINSVYHEINKRKIKAKDGTEKPSKIWKNLLDIDAFVEGFTSLEQRIYDLSNGK